MTRDLTEREREIVKLVAAGDTQKVIAARLGISQRTVEAHLARAREKRGARSSTQLVHSVDSTD